MTAYCLPEVTTKNIQGRGPATVWEFACSDCGQTFDIPKPSLRMSRGRGQDPQDVKLIKRRLEAAGWIYKKHFRTVLCLGCAAKQKAAQQQAMKDNVVMMTKPVSQPPSAAPVAAPPREVTREARRRIADLLETVYDAKAEIYSDAESDETVAKTLSYPRAWVTEVRALMFGAHDRNEAGERMGKEVEELERKLSGVKADLLKQIAGIEEDLKRLRSRSCAA